MTQFILQSLHRLKLPKSEFEFSGYSVGDILAVYYIVELFALAVLSIAAEAISLNYSDFESAFVNSLYGGAEALNEKRRIHDEFNMVLQQSNEFAPAWQSDLVGIVSRFSQYPYAASKICHLIQETYENSFYDTAVKIDTQVVAKYPDLTRKFVQDLMQFLVKYCEMRKMYLRTSCLYNHHGILRQSGD